VTSAPRKQVDEVLAWLKRHGSKRNRDGMARYGIFSEKMFGITVGDLQRYAKELGRSHELALAIWETGWYEARMLAAFIDEPERVAPAQMDRWTRDFDNWGICDTVCMHLFDRTPHAWRKAELWSKKKDEFVKRAAFALMASLALHDKQATDAPFVKFLRLVEGAASDDRNFVRKAVNWALRAIGERSTALNAEAVAIAKRLAASDDATERWVGKDALRQLSTPAVARRLATRSRATALRAAKPKRAASRGA
jgi:3-methyladenine DNA glycosylase AlkD